MPIDLEHVEGTDTVSRNLAKLRNLVIDTGGQSISLRFGSCTITWPGASPRSSNTSVPHGLPTTPIAVYAVAKAGVAGSSTVFPVVAALSPGATTFTVTAVTSDGSSPAAAGTSSAYWLAIG